MSTSQRSAKKEVVDAERELGLDFTPYYLLNGFLPIFWFTYLGVVGTYVVVALFFDASISDTMWVPVIYYALATAFFALAISCVVMARLIKDFDPHRAVQIMKIPVFVAIVVLGLRFFVPVIQYIQTLFVGY